tara:strand:- start:269 stop:1060 length:792 start_codon:yes stop_codon:yes gene_type:complete
MIVIKELRKFKESDRVLVLGHNALDYKSVLKYPFPYKTGRGFHPPAPTSLLFDNWQDFDGDLITCHFQNYNSKFVVASEHSPRFHASKGIKVSNCPAYDKESKEAYKGMMEIGLNPNDFNYFNISKIFSYKDFTLNLYSGHLALIFACDMGYKEVYTAGIDGNVIGYEGGFSYKRKHIKALKQFVRKGKGKKVGIFNHKKPTTMAEWSEWKIYSSFGERVKPLIEYCSEKYPNSKIYKSHKLSLMPVEIKNPMENYERLIRRY